MIRVLDRSQREKGIANAVIGRKYYICTLQQPLRMSFGMTISCDIAGRGDPSILRAPTPQPGRVVVGHMVWPAQRAFRSRPCLFTTTLPLPAQTGKADACRVHAWAGESRACRPTTPCSFFRWAPAGVQRNGGMPNRGSLLGCDGRQDPGHSRPRML
jgi:hypothetical protein